MKTFSFVLISTFFAILLAQDCNNPLLATFNLTGLDTPQIGEGLSFCDNLQSGQTCCSSQTVQGFQERLDNLTTSLQNLAGQRDVYLTELYANYSNQFQRAADDLTDFSDEIDRLQQDNATIGDEARAQYNALNRIANALDNIDDHFRSSVQEYQQRRSVCFNTVLQVQSSAWCLACDPNYANLGVQSDGSVNSSPEVCNAIQSNCALYTERADYFNPLWQAQQAYNRLINLTNYLRDYKNNNYVIPDNVTLENDIFIPTNDTERTSALPENCTQESCQWQCENFFSPSLVLNESIAANGGGILGGDDIDFPPVGSNMPPVVNETTPVVNETETVVNETVVETTEVVNEVTEAGDQVSGSVSGRLLQELQESLWTPNLDGTGLTFNVVDDPADLATIWANNPVFDDSDTNNPTDNTETNTDNDDDFTDNDGINTTENDNTDNDGFDTTNNTDNDGYDTTGNNDNTDNDGFDTTNNTDRDGIDTTGDDTNNDNTNDDDTNPTNPTNDDDDTDN